MREPETGWRVDFTAQAEGDIRGIISYIAEREGPEPAARLLDNFVRARDSLRKLPGRGRIPPELLRVNVLTYREIQAPPYRLIYQMDKAARAVHIHVVANGRRNFTELLKQRLFRVPPGTYWRE